MTRIILGFGWSYSLASYFMDCTKDILGLTEYPKIDVIGQIEVVLDIALLV